MNISDKANATGIALIVHAVERSFIRDVQIVKRVLHGVGEPHHTAMSAARRGSGCWIVERIESKESAKEPIDTQRHCAASLAQAV
jgi:hypothetical protein